MNPWLQGLGGAIGGVLAGVIIGKPFLAFVLCAGGFVAGYLSAR